MWMESLKAWKVEAAEGEQEVSTSGLTLLIFLEAFDSAPFEKQ